MKKSAKFWSVLLSIAMVFSVFSMTACGTTPETPDDPDTPVTPAHTHTYATTWSSDATNHWYAATCEHTTETKDKAAHTFVDGVCSVCNYEQQGEDPDVPTPPVEHVHTFSSSYTINDTQHWKAATCEHTEETIELADHDTDGEGGACSVCGFIPHEHTYKWYYYTDMHWQKVNCASSYKCKGENLDAPKYINLEPHDWVDGVCSVCGFTRTYNSAAECIICDDCGGCINMQCPHEHDEGHEYCRDKHGENAVSTILEAEDAEVWRTDGTESIYNDVDGKRACAHASYSNVTYTINVSKATTATLSIRCGGASTKRESFNAKATIFINGEEFVTNALRTQPTDTEDVKVSMDWLVLGCIELVEGENVIEFCQPGGGWELHIDKIELVTEEGVVITMEKIDNSAITEDYNTQYPVMDKYR